MDLTTAFAIGKQAAQIAFRKLAAAQPSKPNFTPKVDPQAFKPTADERRQTVKNINDRAINKWHVSAPGGGFAGSPLTLDKSKKLYDQDFNYNMTQYLTNPLYSGGGALAGGAGAYALSRLFGGGDDEEEQQFPWLTTTLGAGLGAAALPYFMAQRTTSPTARVSSGFHGDVNTPPASRTGAVVA